MIKWTDEDLLRLDRRYAEEGVAFHARPMRAAMDLLGSGAVLDVLGSPDFQEIESAYQRLIPEVNTTWPGMGIGLATSLDRVRKVVVAIAYGQNTFSLEEGLGFSSREEWLSWCRYDSSIAAGSAFALADLFDLTYGLDELYQSNAVTKYWQMALSNLEDVTNILASGFSVASVLQPVCMTAELAIKGALIYLGDDPKTLGRRDIGHRHVVLAERLARMRPHRDDALIASIVSKLPDYVSSRYDGTHLTRLDVVRLALGVQFIAASSVRRVTNRDLALELECDQWPGPRKPFFNFELRGG
ncbi:hypothetical protein [Burkholderia sp. BCC1644]|uniref:hypothetical protein n=1 Tax=Burkholderia sp. BCC1644 TaxID=2676293 RepID=UPI001FC7FDC4|nr:hypothetical protein [Burkholderia sp. BCC1644]